MRNFIYIVCMVSIIMMISGCGKDEPDDPNKVLDAYISNWTEEDFTSMYKMLSDDAKETYDTEDFIDRYEKIYSDLKVEDVQIKPSDLSDKEKKQALKDKSATYPLQISMDSLAGKIDFETEIDLQLVESEEKDKKDEWQIAWNEGLIFPGLENGGKIRIKTESPKRGEILDRNQMPLAINDTAFEIGVVPGNMDNKSEEIKELARILSLSEDNIKEKLNESWVQDDYFVPLAVIPQTEDEKINELSDIPGMSSKETKGRSYPSGEASAHLTGFIGPITKEEMEEYPEGTYRDGDLIGKRGLEQLYEEKLRGKEGVKIFVATEEAEADEQKEDVLAEIPVEDGENIQLSIDVNTQEKIFDAYGKKAGTSTAIDPKTGEVLALVSSPAFDPNEFIYGISQSQWNELSDDTNQPLLNRFASTFAPGSAIKPLTATIGLKNGTITHDEGIEINGKDWSKKGWGDAVVTRVSTTNKPVDLKLALENSDNIYFAMKAVEMGSDKFIKGMKDLGFNEKLPIKYPIQKSQISNDDKIDEILLANTSYGQGQIEMSALHLAFAYTPFLNEGNMIQPSFLKEDKQGEIWEADLLSKKDAKKMKDYLQSVVENGTASNAKDKDLTISGKTGTAELKASKDTEGDQNGWFVGYPTDDENILIAMMVEDVENDGGSNYVAGKVKNVLKKIKQAEDEN